MYGGAKECVTTNAFVCGTAVIVPLSGQFALDGMQGLRLRLPGATSSVGPFHIEGALVMKTLPTVIFAGLVLASVGASPARGPIPISDAAMPSMPASTLGDLEVRLALLDQQAARTEDRYEREVQPIQAMIMGVTSDTVLATRIALALVQESRATELSPRLLASVLLVENPWLDPDRRSFMGAVGLMQVMPFHAGDWGCASDDLEAIQANICHGAQIFANALERSRGNIDRALLRYNGCVRGTNTPDCFDYPTKVYAQAGKAQMNAWFSGDSSVQLTAGS